MITKGNLFPFWRRFLCTLLFASGALVLLGAITSLRATDKGDGKFSNAATAKIAPWLLQRATDGKEIEFLVVLSDQADLSAAKNFSAKADKGRYVRDTLWAKSQATQQPLLQLLRSRGIPHRSFYIVNMIWVKANLARRNGISSPARRCSHRGKPSDS